MPNGYNEVYFCGAMSLSNVDVDRHKDKFFFRYVFDPISIGLRSDGWHTDVAGLATPSTYPPPPHIRLVEIFRKSKAKD